MPTYSSPSLHKRVTQAEAKKIHKMRLTGIYKTEDTLNEVHYCLDNYRPDAYCFTLLHTQGVFTDYPKEQFSEQVKQWKTVGAECKDYNIKPIEYRGKTFWMFVIQPPDLVKSNFCPLALAFNTLVNGYTYITSKKEIAEWVVKRLA